MLPYPRCWPAKTTVPEAAAMIDIRISLRVCGAIAIAPLPRIGRKMIRHVFVNFSLKVDANSAIRADDFIGADARRGGHVPIRVRDTDVRGIIANDVMRALDSGGDQSIEEMLLSWRGLGSRQRKRIEARRDRDG